MKALSKGVEGIAMGRTRPQADTANVKAEPDLRVSPSLRGPFKPVRALNLKRPGYNKGEQMSINEFDRLQEGCHKDLNSQFYTNQETVKQYLDRTLPLQSR